MCYVKKTSIFFDPTNHTPGAGREIAVSEIPAIAGRQSSTAHRTDRAAGDRDARGEMTRDRNTKNSRRPVLLRTTQRPRSANNEMATTTRHPELRDPRRPDSSEDKLRGVACGVLVHF